MTAEKLLIKLNILNYFLQKYTSDVKYLVMDGEQIWASRHWEKRIRKYQLNLINQFKSEVEGDLLLWMKEERGFGIAQEDIIAIAERSLTASKPE